MRLRGLMVLGVLAFGTAGCGDSVGPPVGSGRDLEFEVPEARYSSAAGTAASVDGLERTNEQAAQMDAALIGEEEAGLPALLWDAYVYVTWQLDQLFISYGLTGAGTGYSMTPTMSIEEPGASKRYLHSTGQSEDQGIWWYQHPFNEEQHSASSLCGSAGEARVAFEVRSRGSIGGIGYSYTNNTNRSARGVQVPCPPATQGNGTLTTTTVVDSGDRIYLCSYELWINSAGDVVALVFLGCEPYGGSVNAT